MNLLKSSYLSVLQSLSVYRIFLELINLLEDGESMISVQERLCMSGKTLLTIMLFQTFDLSLNPKKD